MSKFVQCYCVLLKLLNVEFNNFLFIIHKVIIPCLYKYIILKRSFTTHIPQAHLFHTAELRNSRVH